MMIQRRLLDHKFLRNCHRCRGFLSTHVADVVPEMELNLLGVLIVDGQCDPFMEVLG